MRNRLVSTGNRKSIIIFITVIFVLLFALSAMTAEFWASRESNKYHYPTCRYAERIKPENLIIFDSPKEAQEAGYVPCKVCKPPR